MKIAFNYRLSYSRDAALEDIYWLVHMQLRGIKKLTFSQHIPRQPSNFEITHLHSKI